MRHKDNSIKNIVSHLQKTFGFDKLLINDYWDADNCAIGLTNIQKKDLVYISTHNKNDNEFYVELEKLADNNEHNYISCGTFDNIGVDKVESLIKTHLDLK